MVVHLCSGWSSSSAYVHPVFQHPPNLGRFDHTLSDTALVLGLPWFIPCSMLHTTWSRGMAMHDLCNGFTSIDITICLSATGRGFLCFNNIHYHLTLQSIYEETPLKENISSTPTYHSQDRWLLHGDNDQVRGYQARQTVAFYISSGSVSAPRARLNRDFT